MDGLSESFMARGQTLLKGKPNAVQSSLIPDLFSPLVGDVEDVGDLIDISRYFRYVNGQAELMERVGDFEQHADLIFGENFHNREIVRCLIVSLYDCRYFGRMPLQK